MPNHVPKRIYSASAIEDWFERLSGDWEGLFNDHELSLGQKLYKEGGVSSIELQRGSAIFNGKIGKNDIYALLEWDENGPVVRSSCEEKLQGRALAVAGLYESEELIADGASPLPLETQDDKTTKQGKSGGIFADKSGAGERKLFASSARGELLMRRGPPRPPVAAEAAHAAASRTILVKFVPLEKGLAFDAYWQSLDGGMTPALKLNAGNPTHVNETERERIIRLTALARKSGFDLEGKAHDYFLGDFTRVQELVGKELGVWKKYFHVEASAEVECLARGVQTVSVEVEAAGEDERLKFHWMFLLGDKELERKQIKALLDAGRNPVILPGLGLVKLSDEQADVLTDWRDAILSKEGILPQYMLFSLFRQDALPIRMSKPMEVWTRSLITEPEALPRLPKFLRDYQRKGVAWLDHLLAHGCHPLLADEMGLGKTMQVLSLLQERMGPRSAPALVVAPASVVPVWQAEINARFPKMKVEVLSADNPVRQTSGVLWLSSYGQLKRHGESLEKVDFGFAVLDEAQMIKNPSTKAAKACFGLHAAHRMAITGTPVENRPMDLWSIFRFLMPGLLGGASRFEALETSPDAPRLLGKLYQQVSPFILRRTKAEVAKELPEKIEAVLEASLGPTQREQYARLVEQGLKRFGNDVRRASRERGLGFFTLLTRLRQVSCDAGLLPWVSCGCEESGKIAMLLDKLDGILASGSKVVIFSQFVGFLKRIDAALVGRFPNIPRYMLTGATLDRQKPVNDFQTQEGPALMLVSLRAGGTGITLHAADYLFLMDPWWNPAVEDQAIDRVHRIGQKKTVFVYRIVSEGTVEARIQALKAQKKEIFSNIVGAVRDNTHFALYFKSMQELISLGVEGGESEEA
jgi:hypothetical protein